jgi:hypothetical protein
MEKEKKDDEIEELRTFIRSRLGVNLPIEQTEDMMQSVFNKNTEKNLRDWLAGMALSGIMSNHSLLHNIDDTYNPGEWAYRVADQALKAREE